MPPFQDTEVDKYILHFEKMASSLEWLKEVWTLLLQSVLLGHIQKSVATRLSVNIENTADRQI